MKVRVGGRAGCPQPAAPARWGHRALPATRRLRRYRSEGSVTKVLHSARPAQPGTNIPGNAIRLQWVRSIAITGNSDIQDFEYLRVLEERQYGD